MSAAEGEPPGSATEEPSAQTTESARKFVLESRELTPDEGWLVAGVRLYFVVAPGTPLTEDALTDGPPAPPPGSFPVDPKSFWGFPTKIDDRMLYLMTILAPAPPPGSSALAIEPTYALHDLPRLLAAMRAEAYKRQPSLRAGGAQYVIAYVRTLTPPSEWVAKQARRAKKARRAGQAIPWREEKIPRAVQQYIRDALNLFDAAPIESPRGYYNHFDALTQQTGRLAFGRYAAVLAGLSYATLLTYISLLRCGEMALSGGLTPATFVPTLSLIAQWNSNQDVRENVEQVAALKRSSDAATAGQISISYALAVIGVVLAFISDMRVPALLAPGLALEGICCVFFAAHARSARRGVLRTGTVVFWLGIALLFVGFAADVAKLPLPFPLP